MEVIKITIIGNSVALRVRPPEKYPHNENYTLLLNKKLKKKYPDLFFQIDNFSKGASTIKDKFTSVDDFVSRLPDIYILNIGVVDACTREIPRWFSLLLSSGNTGFAINFFRWINSRLLKKHSAFFVRLRGMKTWVSERNFQEYFTKFIDVLIKDTNAKIIAIPINIADSRVERKLPGSKKNQNRYNHIIKEIIESRGQYLIDVSTLESREHYPDGVHYSASGHKVVSELLMKKISNIIKNERVSEQ
jgi:lysophospholipase L1-like esterase